MKYPSLLLNAFLYLTITPYKTFFLSSGFPFFTEHKIISPTDPLGNLFNLAPVPQTAMVKRFLAPVLSAQFMTAATGRPHEILSFVPVLPPLPIVMDVKTSLRIGVKSIYLFCSSYLLINNKNINFQKLFI